MFEIIKRIYPDHKIVGISGIFIPGMGWCYTLIGGLVDILENDITSIIKEGKDAHGRTIEMVELTLEDKKGFQKTADFSIKELLK